MLLANIYKVFTFYLYIKTFNKKDGLNDNLALHPPYKLRSVSKSLVPSSDAGIPAQISNLEIENAMIKRENSYNSQQYNYYSYVVLKDSAIC